MVTVTVTVMPQYCMQCFVRRRWEHDGPAGGRGGPGRVIRLGRCRVAESAAARARRRGTSLWPSGHRFVCWVSGHMTQVIMAVRTVGRVTPVWARAARLSRENRANALYGHYVGIQHVYPVNRAAVELKFGQLFL